MIILKRKLFRYYGSLLLLVIFIISLIILLFSLTLKIAHNSKLILFIILCILLIVFFTYIVVAMVIAVPIIKFNNEYIEIGKKKWHWNNIAAIRFSELGFLLGQHENQTVLELNKHCKKYIYNSYYSNFITFTEFVYKNRTQLNHPIVEPPPKSITFNGVSGKYSDFRLLSLYGLIFFLSIIMWVWPFFKAPSNIVWVWPQIILTGFMTTWFGLLLYLPNYIEIEGRCLHVRKLFFPFKKWSYQLTELDHLIFYADGRGPRKMMVINKDFIAVSFLISNIKTARLKELKADTEAMGVKVTDKL